MKRCRVIPVLLLKGNGLYKTTRFTSPNYIGDPINAIKIFNDKEVDELLILDIDATKNNQLINLKLIEQMAGEAFMPIGYGGGIKNISDAQKLFSLGVEKIVINTSAYVVPKLITDISTNYGSQSVVVCIDIAKNIFGKKKVYVNSGRLNTKITPSDFAIKCVEYGAGEIIVQSIDKDGTRTGYDIEQIDEISRCVNVPVIACGGANSIEDFYKVIHNSSASAVAAGSMFVYRGGRDSILINYPTEELLRKELFSKIA